MGLVNWNIALKAVGGDEQILLAVIADTLAESPVLLDRLRQALEAGDLTSARRAAHTLRSFGRTFGAEGVLQLAARMETLLEAGEGSAGAALVPELAAQVQAAAEELRERTREAGPSD